MPVVGTGGHVDHGKSTLVHALTGRDPDRWREEKERGLTIDLGFAWARIGEREVSFVDVPGHERFIKNMLAGTGGFDAALLVVAADEGWMPQSEEHLAVLDLLGIRHGLVAITKIDRADPDLVELAALEVEDHLAGTSLENCPIVPVSAVTGEGLAELRSALSSVLAATPPEASGRTRLWVDRVFPVSGAGTVVTGTLVGGPLAVGDQVELLPGGMIGRVRSLQAHETVRTSIPPGTRAAAGIAGIDRHAVGRGSMLGRPGEWIPSSRFLVTLRTARYVEDGLPRRGAYHLHIGSGAWPVRLATTGRLDGEILAVVRAGAPIPVQMGDRFVVRDVGRRSVVAGGRVIEPIAPRRGKDARRVAAALRPSLDQQASRRAAALLLGRRVEDRVVLAAHSGGGIPDGAISTGAVFVAPDHAAQLAGEARRLTAEFHTRNPLRPGIPKASLASRLGIDAETLAAVLTVSGDLEQRGSVVALDDFSPTFSEADELEWRRIRDALEADGLMTPRLKDLDIDPELLHAVIRDRRLVRISEHLAYLPEQVRQLLEALGKLPDRFTVADFRDATGLTRKYSIPILEWMDRRGTTVRSGDERSVVEGRSAHPA